MARAPVSDRALLTLARCAGLSTDWTDAFGKRQRVSVESLRTVLGALGFPAATAADIRDSSARLESGDRATPGLVVATQNEPLQIFTQSRRVALTLEDGRKRGVALRPSRSGVATF